MFLDSLEVHHLRFTCTPWDEVRFGPQAGAQIRGALWDALTRLIGDTVLLERLLALETPDAARGNNPSRPFAIRPPLAERPEADRIYRKDEAFSFGINLFGTVIDLFPYMVQAVYRIGQGGIGYGRGAFKLDAVTAENPLTGQTQTLLDGGHVTGMPDIPVTAGYVAAFAHARNTESVTLRFITPTQLAGPNKQLLSMPDFAYLIPRLLERAQSIAENYAPVATPQPQWRDLYLDLRERAKSVQATRCDTRWINVRSGSRRAGTDKKISGFVGDVTFSGILAPFMPWLVWGQSLQVGKNTVKGDGWYVLV
jgi:hypothetical protein